MRSARWAERDAHVSPSRLVPGHAGEAISAAAPLASGGAEPLDLARALAGIATGATAGLAAATVVWLVLRSVL